MLQSKKQTSLVMAFMAMMLAVALFAPTAQGATPKAGYTQFEGCPSVAENPKSLLCVINVVTGGHFQMGSKDVPIEKPITLVGGTDENFGNFVYNSKGGLLPAKQKVPGGIVGLTGLTWLAEFLGVEALTLYAVTELAGTPNVNFLEEPVELPIKVHLINVALGNKCYVGSTANPISLNLITGTTSPPPPNKPITGKGPLFDFNEETLISFLNDGIFVDNSFAAPAASGCALNLFGLIPVNIDALVNSQSGLPSPAGTNETKQNFDAEFVESELVY